VTSEENDPLEKFSQELAFRALSLTSFAPECVYHYTSAQGLAGILADHAIRATNFTFLNDPTEVQFGRQLVERELAALVDSTDLTVNTFLAAVSRNLTTRSLAEVYVASFSSLDDDLSQWRAYGSSLPERYAIGFDAVSLIDLTIAQANAMYAQVLYRSAQQRDRIRALLGKATAFIRQEPSAALAIELYASVAAMHIVRILPILKDSTYESEAEWRLVLWHRENDAPPKIDASRGVLRPYIPFGLGESLPVVDVNIMAPTRREAAFKAASILLHGSGIHGVTPRHSKIPFAD